MSPNKNLRYVSTQLTRVRRSAGSRRNESEGAGRSVIVGAGGRGYKLDCFVSSFLLGYCVFLGLDFIHVQEYRRTMVRDLEERRFGGGPIIATVRDVLNWIFND